MRTEKIDHQYLGRDTEPEHIEIARPWIELARRLEEIAPGKLKKSFRAMGGTEAVEIALQAG